MMEYFDMLEATAAAIDDEGWLHTGDSMMDERGYTRIEGRLKDMIIRGGEIFIREIEDVLFEHAASQRSPSSVCLTRNGARPLQQC